MIKKGIYIQTLKQKTLLPYQQVEIQLDNNYNPFENNNFLVVLTEVDQKELEEFNEKNENIEINKKYNNLSQFGCLLKIQQIKQVYQQNIQNEIVNVNSVRVYKCESIAKIKIVQIQKEKQYYKGDVEIIVDKKDIEGSKLKQQAELMYQLFSEYYLKRQQNQTFIFDQYQINKLIYFIIVRVKLSYLEELLFLQSDNTEAKVDKIIDLLKMKIEEYKVDTKVIQTIKQDINKKLREDVIKRKMHELKKQLNDIEENNEDDDISSEEQLSKIFNSKKQMMPDYVQKVVRQQLRKLKMQQSGQNSQESNVTLNYLECLLDLPWFNRSLHDDLDFKRTSAILDQQHYGLSEVKQRILQFLSVRQLRKQYNQFQQKIQERGSIICLVGPPGTGKTSLAKSIALGLNREFNRISLGGVTDESEIRGHRRTYVGAQPGSIIQILRKQQYSNSVLLLDEIDKLCDRKNSYKGDVQNSLLEILDYNQNHQFKDHYVELPVDLSDILFICTANDIQNISGPLKDRLEIIQIEGYTELEKLEIAKRHIVQKQITLNGLSNVLSQQQTSIEDKVILEIIRNYTREAGVRELERQIEKVYRVQARDYLEEKEVKGIIESNLEYYLGGCRYKEYTEQIMNQSKEIGTAIGLAYTSYGGSIMLIECRYQLNSKKQQQVFITGSIQEVMKESVQTALAFINTHFTFNQNGQSWNDLDIYLHFPQAAVPKDGPSAGITILMALLSAFYHVNITNATAFTGEISLLGSVLPVGGIKQKVLAAHQASIKQIILSSLNQIDTQKLTQDVLKEISFIFVKNVFQVIEHGFDQKDQEIILRNRIVNSKL